MMGWFNNTNGLINSESTEESFAEMFGGTMPKFKVDKKEKDEIKKKFKNSRVYLDSNIFMDFKFDNIFDYMINNKVKVTIIKSQYDEMINLRKKYKDSKTNKAKSLLPQLTLAFNRVEKLLDNTKSNIKDIGFDSEKNAYADIDFIKVILNKLKKDKSIVFVTQDRDLRTRLKTMIKEDKKISKKNVNIFKADEFIVWVNIIENIIDDNKESAVKGTVSSEIGNIFERAFSAKTNSKFGV